MIKKINVVLQKTTIKNGIWLYILQIFNTVIPLLTLPYITRILGATEYGVFSIALNIIGYFQVIVEYGFGMSGSRKVALLKDKSKLNLFFTTIILSRAILCVGCFIFIYIYIFLGGSDMKQNLCILILFINIVGIVLQQTWIFQGLQQMKYITIISVISRIISVIFIFMFVKTQDDLYIYCILYSLAPVINGIIGTSIVVSKYNLKIIKVSLRSIWNEIKDGWYVFTTSMSSKIFGAIGITFLGLFSETSTVGIYSAIQKIPTIMMFAWAPINQVIYPISSKEMTKSYLEGKKYVYNMRKKIFPIFLIFSLIVAVLAKSVVGIMYGKEYSEYFYWIYPLLLWLIISINNNFWGIQILLGGGYSKEYSECFQIGIFCTIILNFIFIYTYGGLGAAMAPFISEVILGILLKVKINKLDLINATS